jgi:nucleotide-binding universal stress UspA family protein
MAYPIKMILVPMQLDDPDATALRVAKRLAQESDAEICAMHIIPEDPRAIPPGASSTDMLERDQEKATADLQRVAGPHLAGIKHQLLTPFSVSGNTEIAATIIQTAKDVDADLIVMKTHSRHGIAHFILGSVAEQVVRESPCPVLTLTSAAKERFLAP